jgi:hypothetical protein
MSKENDLFAIRKGNAMKTTIVLMILLMASSLHAQETSTWKALNAKVDTLYRQKRYDEAIQLAEKS